MTLSMANVASGQVITSTLRQCLRTISSQRPKPRLLRAYLPCRPARSISTHTHAHQASSLSVLPTAVDGSSTEFQDNSRSMDQLLASSNDLHKQLAQGGPQKAKAKHLARGKMLVRE